MRLLILQVLYVGTIFTSIQLGKVIRKHSNYIFEVYNYIHKSYSKVYYSKDINKFIIEIDNGIYSKEILDLSCKLEIKNIWKLEN